jgi:hypothetical protein
MRKVKEHLPLSFILYSPFRKLFQIQFVDQWTEYVQVTMDAYEIEIIFSRQLFM